MQSYPFTAIVGSDDLRLGPAGDPAVRMGAELVPLGEIARGDTHAAARTIIPEVHARTRRAA